MISFEDMIARVPRTEAETSPENTYDTPLQRQYRLWAAIIQASRKGNNTPFSELPHDDPDYTFRVDGVQDGFPTQEFSVGDIRYEQHEVNGQTKFHLFHVVDAETGAVLVFDDRIHVIGAVEETRIVTS